MPISGHRKVHPKENENIDRRKLLAALTEMRARGIKLPPEFVAREVKWKSDSRGYFVRRDGRFFTPYEKQEEFVKSPSFFSALGGSRGCGKTSSGSQKALQKIRSGGNGIIINPDFENLKISTWPEFREWLPWEMIVPAHQYRRNPEWEPHQPFTLAFLNGVKVIVKGVKDPDSARGPNVNWLWYDEAQRDEDGLAWKTAVASVRVGENPQAWATFTPNGMDHWTHQFFVQQKLPEDAVKLFEETSKGRNLVEFYHGTIYDNQENLDKGFMAAMLAAYPSGWLRQQEIMGEFVKKEGALGDRTWFNGMIIPSPPLIIKGRVRYWDLAATEKKVTGKKVNDPDETVGTRMSWDGKYFYIENQICGFWAWDDIKDTIVETAKLDGPYTKIFIEQEPAAGGKNQIAEIAKYVRENLPGHPRVEGYRPEGDKVMRANTWFAEAKEGLIFLIQGEWIFPFFEQLDCFNMCRHDDKIDSISGARYKIAPIKRWSSVSFLHL